MQEFEHCLDTAPEVCLDGHLRRGDFSRWVAEVLGDYVLAASLRTLEARHREAPGARTVPDMVGAIRRRYAFVSDDAAPRHRSVA